MTTDVLVDIPAARTWLPGVPASTIRVWVARGRLVRRGTDRRGRGLYLLCDIEALAVDSSGRDGDRVTHPGMIRTWATRGHLTRARAGM